MNSMRHRSARFARRQPLRRVALLTLACLVAMAGSNFKFDGGRTGAATKQQGTKLPSPMRKVPSVETAQGNKPSKDAKSLTVVPATTSCPNKTPISPGQPINGALAGTDCGIGDGSFYDEYTFNATSGQQVSVSMSSTDFDTYLFLLKPGETAPTQATLQDDDGGGGTNSRIPATSGVITLPTTGTYSILANSFVAGAVGNYSVTLTFGGTGGTICPPNPTPIVNGQTLTGTLASGDCTLTDGSFYDAYSFSAQAGQQVTITMTGTAPLDPYLILLAPDTSDLAEDDNGGGGTTARIPATGGFAALPQTGTYTINANSALSGQSGSYSISLSFAATNCPSTAVNIGQTVNGSLANTDCRLPADGSFLDAYTFNGTVGQQVAITMTSTAPGLDPFLFLLSPTGSALIGDDNSAGGTNARIPGPTGFFTLPTTGTYTILANSAAANQTGAYALALTTAASCTYTFAQPSRNVAAAGGSFSVGVTTQAGCALTAAQVTSNASWLTVSSAAVDGTGAGTVNYTVAANPAGVARTGTLTLAGQTFTVTQDANCTYAIYPTIRPFRADGGTQGRLTVVTSGGGCPWTAASDAPWLTITAGTTGTGTGRVRYTVAQNTGAATRTGHIIINANSTNPITHTVTQTAVGTTPMVQFSAATYTVAENDASNSATITVARLGDTAGAATVEYSTIDDPAAVPCDPTITNNGQPFPQGKAYARCDYATTVDTLTFAPNETTKTFVIPLINDVHVEGNETFQVQLANAEGATLGTQTSATITLTDNDTVQPTTNPIKATNFFVRQQYLDFLSREPDPGGFSGWVNLLNGCSNVESNPACDRINVSSSFFGSPEFQLKGTFVFLFEKVAFGNAGNPNYVPEYADFATDLRRVTGTTSEEVFAKRLDFTEDFVTRLAFTNRYNGLTNAQYVDTLLANVNATLATPDPQSGVTRTSLVNDLNAGTKTRADVLRAIVESAEVGQKQFNYTFVATEYYGYLRRTPEAVGYQNWLSYLAAHPTDNRTMVNGFMNSVEYKLRFGPNVP